jgi:hypothetical protein
MSGRFVSVHTGPLFGTVTSAISHGANVAIELHSGYESDLTPTQIAAISACLA